jgi:hypothetical protein
MVLLSLALRCQGESMNNKCKCGHDHWHKVCAILMMRLGKTSLEITEADVAALGNNEKR